jgi:hypothetical protein
MIQTTPAALREQTRMFASSQSKIGDTQTYYVHNTRPLRNKNNSSAKNNTNTRKSRLFRTQFLPQLK